jgi:hypothetical protein
MTFDNPQGLWLLTLAVPILVFHFYKGRIRKMAVPMLLFWEQVIVEEERKTALKRLRHWASLLVALTALVVLTSAVSAPNVKGLTRPKQRYALLLDNTPSMAAVEPDGRTRARAAIDRAREFLDTLAYGDQVSVLDLSGSRTPFTSDLDAVRAQLSAPRPGPRGAERDRIGAALAAGDDVVSVLFTDRPPAGVEEWLADGRLRIVRVGTPRDNAGWVSGLLSRRPGEKRVTLSLKAESFSASKVEREELLSLNGKALARRKLELEPGVPVEREWVLDPAKYPGSRLEEGGLVEVALEPADSFHLDDTASFVVPPLLPPSLVVVHPGAPSERLMHAVETLRSGGLIAQNPGVVPVERYAALRSRLGEGWIVIFDRVAPAALPERGATLIIGAPGPGAVEKPSVIDWDREAPPNHRVDYAGLHFRRSRILSGEPLLRSIDGPLATWSSRGGRASVELGFPIELEETDIAARPTFLMMLINFAEWASYRGLRAFPTEFAMGQPIRAERPLWFDEGEITFAQGDRAERAAVRRGVASSSPPADPGFIRMSAAGRTEWSAVNLFDAAESDLRELAAGPAGAPLPPPAPWFAKIPYAFLAVAAVLALLVLEWVLYHRGLI